MSQSTEKLFDEIAQFVSESKKMLDSGAVMEMAGLDDQVRSLCQEVLQLSENDRVIYADRLQQLLGDLKTLGDKMVEQRDLLAEEIRGISHHKKASVAYKVVDASDDFGNKDEED